MINHQIWKPSQFLHLAQKAINSKNAKPILLDKTVSKKQHKVENGAFLVAIPDFFYCLYKLLLQDELQTTEL